MSSLNNDINVTIGVSILPMVFKFKKTNTDPVEYLDLTGWTVKSEVRRKSGGDVVMNLDPTISNATGGEVLITKTDEQTSVLEKGVYKWDIILEDDSGNVLGPYVGGRFVVNEKITDS